MTVDYLCFLFQSVVSVGVLLSFFYNVVVAWAIFYLFASISLTGNYYSKANVSLSYLYYNIKAAHPSGPSAVTPIIHQHATQINKKQQVVM